MRKTCLKLLPSLYKTTTLGTTQKGGTFMQSVNYFRKKVHREYSTWSTPEHKFRSTTTSALICYLSLSFIITKYPKHVVGDDLSVCIDERSPYGLSVTEDIKIDQCHVIKW